MHKLFSNLIWPAIAGNVAWAFFSVAVAEEWSSPMIARLLSLALVAGYLMISWSRDRQVIDPWPYYLFDSLFAIAIVTFAIATQDSSLASKPFVSLWLAAILAVAASGHIYAVWEPTRSKEQRRLLALANISGIAILIVGFWLFQEETLWHRPFAVAIVVTWWLSVLRRYQLPS